MYRSVKWTDEVGAAPWRFDFFSTLRYIDAQTPGSPSLGTAARLKDDPLRLTQAVSMAFESAMLRSPQVQDGQVPRLPVTFFGLTGSNGPMPSRFTEDLVGRQANHNDPMASDFLDIFHHRLLSLFYRSWAQARPVVSADRPHNDRFADYVSAFAPRGERYYAGALANQRRSADGLISMLKDAFGVGVKLQPLQPRRQALADSQRLRLGGRQAASVLGASSLLGRQMWNVQHSFRLCLGPLSFRQYQRFLPGGEDCARLSRWVDDYAGLTFAWDLELQLAAAQRPPLRLSASLPLGHACWLGSRIHPHPTTARAFTPVRFRSATTGNHRV